MARDKDPQHTACPDVAALVTSGWGEQLDGSGVLGMPGRGAGDAWL